MKSSLSIISVMDSGSCVVSKKASPYLCSFFFFCIWISSRSSTICWRDHFALLPLLLCQRLHDYIYGGLFLGPLFCSIYLFVHYFKQYHVFWVLSFIVSLKAKLPTLSTLFFSFNTELAILGLVPLHITFGINLSIFIK